MPTRIRDVQLVHAIIRSVLSSPSDEFGMLAMYLLAPHADDLEETSNGWKFTGEFGPAEVDDRKLRGLVATHVLSHPPEIIKGIAADVLGVTAEYDDREWAEWLIEPNENYSGCFDIELGIKDPVIDDATSSS